MADLDFVLNNLFNFTFSDMLLPVACFEDEVNLQQVRLNYSTCLIKPVIYIEIGYKIFLNYQYHYSFLFNSWNQRYFFKLCKFYYNNYLNLKKFSQVYTSDDRAASGTPSRSWFRTNVGKFWCQLRFLSWIRVKNAECSI